MVVETPGMENDRPASLYREFVPPPALATHFLCSWVQRIGPGGAAYPQRVLPDGCMDIVWIGEAAPVVVGPATRTVTAPLPPGSVVIGARLRPGAAPGLLRLPASEFLNREVPLREVWGTAVLELAGDVAARRATVEAALAARLAAAPPADACIAAAVVWLARHPAGRVHELGPLLGISGRQLQRRFAAAVGCGPKMFQRVLRFQRVLALAQRRPPGDAASLAAEAGYADQAHMIREVRAFADCSPRALLGSAGGTPAMSDFFKTAAAPGV